jgi:hypothetical protein
MTASSLSPMDTRARERRRRRSLCGYRATALFGLLLMLFAPAFGGRALAEEPVKGDVNVSTDGGYARLAFRFEKEMPATVRVTFPVMVVTFKKPVAIKVDRLNTGAPDYISVARLDPDGTSIRIALTRKVKLNSMPVAERLYVDLLPETWAGAMPSLPQEVVEELANRALEAERQLRQKRTSAKPASPSMIRVKVATQPTFTRYVFPMPDAANVVPENSEGKLTLEFDQPIKWDLADAKGAMPKTLKSVDADVETDSAIVTFSLNGTPQVRTFREDRSIVVDVGHDNAKPQTLLKPAAEAAKPKQAAATLAAMPAIEPPETVPAAGRSGCTRAVHCSHCGAAAGESRGKSATRTGHARAAATAREIRNGRTQAAGAQSGLARRRRSATDRQLLARRIPVRGRHAGRHVPARRHAMAGVRQRRQDRSRNAHNR